MRSRCDPSVYHRRKGAVPDDRNGGHGPTVADNTRRSAMAVWSGHSCSAATFTGIATPANTLLSLIGGSKTVRIGTTPPQIGSS